MSLLDHFKAIPTLDAGEVRELIDKLDPGEYNLVDVRQAGEYEGEHIPGAKLIPIGELEERIGELDPSKPTVTY
jgi:rhodanese-related sulfurtransferase